MKSERRSILERQQNKVRGALSLGKRRGKENAGQDLLLRASVRNVLLDVREDLPREQRHRFFSWLEKLASSDALGLAGPLQSNLTSSAPRATTVDVSSELEWIAYRLRPNLVYLQDFRKCADQLNHAFWNDSWAECEPILDELKKQFGVSLWLIGAEIAIRQYFHGLESQKSTVTEVRRAYPAGIPAFFAFHLSVRNEQRSTYHLFNEDFSSRLSGSKIEPELQTYLKYKIMGEFTPSDNYLSTILMFEQGQSIIDVYETTIDLLQRSLSVNTSPRWRRSAIPLLEMLSDIGDIRVAKLLFSLTGRLTRPDVAEFQPLQCISSTCQDLVADDPWRTFWWLVTQGDDFRGDKNASDVTTRTCALLRSILVRDGDFEESRGRLLKFARNFSFLPTAVGLRSLVDFVTIQVANTNGTLGAVALNSRAFTPADALCVHSAAAEQAKSLLVACEGPSIVDLWLGLGKTTTDPKVQPLSWYLASLHEAVNSPPSALRTISALRADALPKVVQNLVSNLKIQLLLREGEWDTAIELIASEATEYPEALSIMPADEAVADRDWESLSRVNDKIDLAITLYAHWRQSEDSLYATYLRFAFEDALMDMGLQLPSQLDPTLCRNPRRAVFFLSNICIPVLMDTSGLFISSEELQAERLSILARLADLDYANIDRYSDETSRIKAGALIKSGLQIVDSNRVNVDTAALSRWAFKRYQESYLRYLALVEADIGTSSRFDDIVAAFKNMSSSKGEYFAIPESEADTLLLEIVLDIKKRFLEDSQYGLEYFLGKRIRHGSIAGHMRGPVERAGLISERASSSSPYADNAEWLPRLSFKNADCREEARRAFVNFSEEYDQLIAYVRDRKLHVKSSSHPDGIFDATVTTGHYHLLKSLARPDFDFESFFTTCINMNWTLLDAPLQAAKDLLTLEVKSKADELFSSLRASLRDASIPDDSLTMLFVAIQSTNTEVQRQLDTAANWFNRAESKQAGHLFTLEEIIQVAVQSALTTLSGFRPNIVTQVDGDVRANASLILALADAVFVVLDNVYRRARVGNEPDILVKAVIDTEASTLALDIRNPIGEDTDLDALDRKLEVLRSKIAAGDIASGASADRGSGLLKMAALARQYPSGALSFSVHEGEEFRTSLVLPAIIHNDRLTLPMPEVH